MTRDLAVLLSVFPPSPTELFALYLQQHNLALFHFLIYLSIKFAPERETLLFERDP